MNNTFKAGFVKTAGFWGSSVDDIAAAAKKIGDSYAKGGNKITHNLDPKQMHQIMSKIDDIAKKLQPKIGPKHLLGASIIAGMGFPIGSAIAKGSSETAKAILEVPSPQVVQENAGSLAGSEGLPPQFNRRGF